MTAEVFLVRLPFETSLVEKGGLSSESIDIVGISTYLSEQLGLRPEIIQIGLLGLAELDNYYEGGLPQNVRDAFFVFYLNEQSIKAHIIARALYGSDYSREDFADISYGIDDVRKASDPELVKARNRFFYIAGQTQLGITDEKIEFVEDAENKLRDGMSCEVIADSMRLSRLHFDEDDSYVVQSKLIVEAQMLKRADQKLSALARLGLSDSDIFKRLAMATGNFRHVATTDVGTYALQVRIAMHMMADGEQEGMVKGVTGLSDEDFTQLTEYLQREKPEAAVTMSQELVEYAKQGISVKEWYWKLRELHFNSSRIMRHPLFAARLIKEAEQRIRDGVAGRKTLMDEGVVPRQVITSLIEGQKDYRRQLYEQIVSTKDDEGVGIIDVYNALREKGFVIKAILADQRIFVPLQQQVLLLQGQNVSWREIEERTGITARALQDLSKDAILTGKKQPKKVGTGGLTRQEWAELDEQVLECIGTGVTEYSAIAERLGIKRWQAHHSTVHLIKAGRTSSRRNVR